MVTTKRADSVLTSGGTLEAAWSLAPVAAMIAIFAACSGPGTASSDSDSAAPEVDSCEGLFEGEVCEGRTIRRYRCGAGEDVVEKCEFGCQGDRSPRCCELSATPSCDADRVVQRDDCGQIQRIVETCPEGKLCGGGQCVDDICRITFDLTNNLCTSRSDLDGWDNPLDYAVISIDGVTTLQMSGALYVDVPGYDSVHEITCGGHMRRDDVWAHCPASQVDEVRCSRGTALVFHSCLDIASVPGQCF
jgi:hypothetical protein